MPFTAIGAYDCLSALTKSVIAVTGLTHMDDRHVGHLIRVASASQIIVYLPPARSNAGKWIGFTFDGLSAGALCGIYPEEGSSSALIQGIRASTSRWYCSGEVAILYCDGVNWIIKHETFATAAFQAYRTAVSYQTVASATYVKMQLDNVQYDIGGFWDAVNYRYRPFAPGRYWVNLQTYSSSVIVATRYLTAVPYVNGSLYAWNSHFRNGADVNAAVNIQFEVYLNGGMLVGASNADYLEMFVYHNTTTNESVGDQITRMRGVRISRE
jgi:hypothetical protein